MRTSTTAQTRENTGRNAKDWRRSIPSLLIAVRCILGPVLAILAVTHQSAPAILLVLVTAMLTDVFDGVVARRLGIVTPALRAADSRADLWFIGWVGLAAWLTGRGVIVQYSVPLILEVVLQIGSYVFDLARYGRLTTLHAYSAKLWGLSIYLAAGCLLAFHSGALLWPSIVLGWISFVDALAIKLILPGWQFDILSFRHALRRVRSSAPAI